MVGSGNLSKVVRVMKVDLGFDVHKSFSFFCRNSQAHPSTRFFLGLLG